MLEYLVDHHDHLINIVYFSAVSLIATTESLWPRRPLAAPMHVRWFGNISISLLCFALVHSVFPLLMVGVALWAESTHWGLFNQWQSSTASGVAFFVSLLLLDLGRYTQHFLLHRIAWLWRFHRVHHTDQDYDFSTGIRFHPIEAIISTGLDILLVFLFGLPPAAVATYLIVQAFWSIFAHSNVWIPASLDRVMRLALITPDLHRTHHSAEPGECMTNYGGITPLWDHLFGTYQDQPIKGHIGMTIGLQGYESSDELRLGRMLLLPFHTQNSSRYTQVLQRIKPTIKNILNI